MISNASYFRLVTLVIPGVAGAGNIGTSFTFADQPDLRYARLQGMVFLTDADMITAQPESTPVVSAAQIAKLSFVFRTNDPDDQVKKGMPPNSDQKAQGALGRFTGTLDTIQWIPASLLHINQSNTGGGQPSFVRQMIHWKDRYLIWQDSTLKVSPGGLANTTDVAVVLGVFYTFVGTHGTIISPRN